MPDDGTFRLKQGFTENGRLENAWALREGELPQTMANGTGLNILFDDHGNEAGWEKIKEHRHVRGVRQVGLTAEEGAVRGTPSFVESALTAGMFPCCLHSS